MVLGDDAAEDAWSPSRAPRPLMEASVQEALQTRADELVMLGETYYGLDDFTQAIAYFSQAQELVQALPHSESQLSMVQDVAVHLCRAYFGSAEAEEQGGANERAIELGEAALSHGTAASQRPCHDVLQVRGLLARLLH